MVADPGGYDSDPDPTFKKTGGESDHLDPIGSGSVPLYFEEKLIFKEAILEIKRITRLTSRFFLLQLFNDECICQKKSSF